VVDVENGTLAQLHQAAIATLAVITLKYDLAQ